MAAASMIPGLTWGVLAETDESLVGVTFSHCIVGWFFFNCLSMSEALYRLHG
jgi:hypothetical protein